MKNSSTKQIKGVVPPMVSPFLADKNLDTESGSKLTVPIISGGVHMIFILGTTGEAAGSPGDVFVRPTKL